MNKDSKVTEIGKGAFGVVYGFLCPEDGMSKVIKCIVNKEGSESENKYYGRIKSSMQESLELLRNVDLNSIIKLQQERFYYNEKTNQIVFYGVILRQEGKSLARVIESWIDE